MLRRSFDSRKKYAHTPTLSGSTGSGVHSTSQLCKKPHTAKLYAAALVAVAALLACTLCGCQSKPATEEPALEFTSSITDTKNALTVSLHQGTDGKVTTERPVRKEPYPMGEEGTWTIFVYMCGSDLESIDGRATEDIREMQSASTGNNVRFVIQAGGSSVWQNEDMPGKSNYRIVIRNGQTKYIPQKGNKNMGDSKTLTEFLNWGIKKYPAANMGLIFWDHGGGSLAGVCTDDLFKGDTLTLREIDSSLLSVYDQMTSNFAFIGFDACLMSTLEVANTCATYADYLYASEDLETGAGWDYFEIGSALGENSSISARDLGQKVGDTYFDACKESGEDADATFSVLDLSAVDKVVSDFGYFAYQLYSGTRDHDNLVQFVRAAQKVDNFGGNNNIEGYTNMVDLQGLLSATDSLNAGQSEAMRSLDSLVAYKINGANHPNACGVSTYWPIDFQGNDEIEGFSQVATSPYYLALADRSAFCGTFGKKITDYSPIDALTAWGTTQVKVADNGTYTVEGQKVPGYWNNYGDGTGESTLITFEQQPAIDDNGHLFFQLSSDALENTAKVEACIDALGTKEAETIELGYSTDLTANWDTGTFTDAFDGTWISLPDGQHLALYAVGQTRDENYDIYTSPVLVNNEGTNLRILHNTKDGTATIDGVWDGVYENGVSPRITNKLTRGDLITPYYYAPFATDKKELKGSTLNVTTTEDGQLILQGAPYAYEDQPALDFGQLDDGQYSYFFVIQDIFGNQYSTDGVVFDVKDGAVTFAE